MGTRPCVVTEDIAVTWDGVSQRLVRGQLIDVPPGSALERAIGLDHLATLSGVPLAAPAKAAGPEQEPQAPDGAKKRNGKNDDTGAAATAPAAETASPEGDH